MEDYEYKVIKLHATLFQNSSKSTGNVSKNTSKFAGGTDQIRLGGGPWGGLLLDRGGAMGLGGTGRKEHLLPGGT